MTSEELRGWLKEHSDEIFTFTDYEAVAGSEEALLHNLETSWFRDSRWNEPGYHFVPLGQDGTGGEAVLWLSPRPSVSSCVVFFGSEGGRGVLAPGAGEFARALAYGPVITEFGQGSPRAPSLLSIDDNWYFREKDPVRCAAARRALLSYRRAVEECWGPLPPFEELTAVPEELQAEFCGWVDAVRARLEEQERRERERLAREKLNVLRSKASEYAARSAASLPATVSVLPDGSRFEGTCSSCGSVSTCRVMRFEGLVFGLCVECYFSSAW